MSTPYGCGEPSASTPTTGPPRDAPATGCASATRPICGRSPPRRSPPATGRPDAPSATRNCPAGARAAASLLGPLGNRWGHTKAAARQAGSLAHLLPTGQRPLLLAAAWAHDLGRSPALAATSFHPLDGARGLTGLLPPTVVALIAHHTGAIHEARRRGLANALAAYPQQTGPLADALTFADLTAGAAGQETNVGDRLADIHRRYGPDSLTIRAVADATPDLLAAVSRTQSRLLADRARRPRLPRPAAGPAPARAASTEIATRKDKP
jgi:hypothetical protein